MFFTFVLLARKYRQYLVMVLVAIALIMPYVAPDRVRARIAETFAPEKSYVVFGKKMGLSESAAARVDSWKVGFELWAKRPVLGHGIPLGGGGGQSVYQGLKRDRPAWYPGFLLDCLLPFQSRRGGI